MCRTSLDTHTTYACVVKSEKNDDAVDITGLFLILNEIKIRKVEMNSRIAYEKN